MSVHSIIIAFLFQTFKTLPKSKEKFQGILSAGNQGGSDQNYRHGLELME